MGCTCKLGSCRLLIRSRERSCARCLRLTFSCRISKSMGQQSSDNYRARAVAALGVVAFPWPNASPFHHGWIEMESIRDHTYLFRHRRRMTFYFPKKSEKGRQRPSIVRTAIFASTKKLVPRFLYQKRPATETEGLLVSARCDTRNICMQHSPVLPAVFAE